MYEAGKCLSGTGTLLKALALEAAQRNNYKYQYPERDSNTWSQPVSGLKPYTRMLFRIYEAT